MNAQVVCHPRVGVTLTFKLKDQDAVLGRDPGIAISVPVEGVSRQHAKIRWDGKVYWLEDLTSTNGTFLNGLAAVRERLNHLDVIGLGRKIDLVFLLRAPDVAATRQGIVEAALLAEGEGLAPVPIAAGEITLGRAPSNNVVVDSTAVSKVHARIERTIDQLVLEDLGSANGTYVNGARVMNAFLADGDLVSLAGVEAFRVSVTLGEVKGPSTSARMRSPVAPAERQHFGGEWKTRFDWDSGEREALEDMRRQIRERERSREQQGAKKPAAGKAAGHAAKAAAAKPPAGAAKAAAPAAAKPGTPPAAPAPKPAADVAKAVAPAAAKAVAPPPAAPSPAPPPPVPAKPPVVAAPPPRPAPPVPSPKVVAPPVIAKPSSAAAAPRETAPVPARPASSVAPVAKPAGPPALPGETLPLPPETPEPTAFVSPKATTPDRPAAPVVGKSSKILEIQLLGEGFELSVREPGAHDLGRATEAPLRANHPTVSRKHARVILADDRGIAYLQDAGGANGTRLNGQAIEKLAPLSDGDRVGIGEVELTVVLKRG